MVVPLPTSQEMTLWNADFSRVLNTLTEQWINVMTDAIERGKKNGFVHKDVNAKQATLL